MANQVSVSSQAVKSGIHCCQVSIQELHSAYRRLATNYQRAGAGGWRDQKYKELGEIVQECCQAMVMPEKELQECLVKLNLLLKTVEAYETTQI